MCSGSVLVVVGIYLLPWGTKGGDATARLLRKEACACKRRLVALSRPMGTTEAGLLSEHGSNICPEMTILPPLTDSLGGIDLLMRLSLKTMPNSGLKTGVGALCADFGPFRDGF